MPESCIELRGVGRSFGALRALHDITVRAPRGAVVALIGPSGSGKTTLLNLVAGLDRPTSGALRVLGADLAALDEAGRAALRRRIGLVFQSFALLPALTAAENVELGLRLAGDVPRAAWETRVAMCLEAVGLAAWSRHRAYELSGGQQQRVAIARALAPGPALLVADEPTGDLDAAGAVHILALLRDLAARAGLTVLLATHDPVAIAAADVYIELRDGALVRTQSMQPT